MIRIVLIDDHPLAINGIGEWLYATGRFIIVGTARSLEEGHSLMETLEYLPEIVILDISLGNEDGLNFIPTLNKIAKERKTTPPGVLVCSMYEDPFLIQRAMGSGAKAYVAKSAESKEIITAIDAILSGKTYIDPRYRIDKSKSSWSLLTQRENEIVTFIKQSFSTRQIAKRLGISLRTVENHLTNIYIKTDTTSRGDLMEL
jgi:NarL family two-component system response regulator LiaR